MSNEVVRAAGALLGIAGGIAFFASWLFRRPESSLRLSVHPRDWKPMWRLRGEFKPWGFPLMVIGWALVVLGGVIVFGLPFL